MKDNRFKFSVDGATVGGLGLALLDSNAISKKQRKTVLAKLRNEEQKNRISSLERRISKDQADLNKLPVKSDRDKAGVARRGREVARLEAELVRVKRNEF